MNRPRRISLYLIFALLAAPQSSALSAQPAEPQTGYLLEAILFKNLRAEGEGKPVMEIRDYSPPDIHLPDRDTRITDNPQRSEKMQLTWERLRGSRNFRPLAYVQWLEPAANTVSRHTGTGVLGNPVYLHGEVILQSPRAGPDTAFTDLSGQPVYQIQGRLQFGQSRFLHVKLDFQYREPLVETGSEPASNETEQSGASRYRVFDLRKNRQIQVGRAELFDNERFGVIVYLQKLDSHEEDRGETAE